MKSAVFGASERINRVVFSFVSGRGENVMLHTQRVWGSTRMYVLQMLRLPLHPPQLQRCQPRYRLAPG